MNKLTTLFLSTIALSIFLTACNKEQNPIAKADSHKVLEAPAIDVVVGEIPIAGFTDLVNNANIDVVVVPDANPNVIVEAVDYTTLAQVDAQVTNGTLTVAAPAGMTSEATVYVHTPIVGKVKLEKQGNVQITGNYSLLEIQMKDKGGATLTGSATTLRITGKGDGTIDALGMPAIDVVVNMKDDARVLVAAQSTLNVDIKDNVKVFYTGNPTVTKKIKDSAKLKKL